MPKKYNQPLRWAILLLLVTSSSAAAQRGEHTLFGDLKVDESKSSGLKPLSFDLILYTEGGGMVVSRQTVTTNGRYRFMNLPDGRYDLVVEVENHEVARVRVLIQSPFKNDFRQDIALEWNENPSGSGTKKGGTVSVADFYQRTPTNKGLFEKANALIEKKNYSEATTLLRQIVTSDVKDYQAWSELGTVYLMQKNTDEAEKAYLQALQARPSFGLAALNLGRLRLMQKKYDGAIEVLNQAVTAQPQSADAQYYLGEAYLQNRKGSKAVGHLEEAVRLDPARMAKAHLRLAALYNAAGMKDRAAVEYEKFLLKTPDHPEREKLRRYIAENKKP